jgi:predicted dehydrogenase
MSTTVVSTRTLRLGFVGVGWIGLDRLRSLASNGLAEVAGVCDPSDEAVSRAMAIAPGVQRARDLQALLDADLDGLVIATPNVLHVEQAVAALERGIAVFCQKPLARTERETRRVIDAARANDRLMAVDLSYRHTDGMRRIRELVKTGALGRVHAVDMEFHNAFGPDKRWFRDFSLSGGGCVLDLGIHLVDLLLWMLDDGVQQVHARLYSQGRLLPPAPDTVEDDSVVQLQLASGATATMRCSWYAHAGRDAVIHVSLRGSDGGADWHNVGGSFLDFAAERHHRTSSEVLSTPPEDWGGRAALAWLDALAAGGRYDADVESLCRVAATLDAIYGRCGA